MDSRVDDLIEKYWNAETSIEEEKELKARLAESDDEAHEELKGLLSHFETEAKVALDASFDEQILAMIEEKSEAKVVSFNTYFKRYASMAAAVLVMAISTVMFVQNQQTYTSEDTFDTPEEAYAALKEQLMMVSNLMNKGNKTVNELSTLGTAADELSVIGKMSSAETSLELLEEMNRNN